MRSLLSSALFIAGFTASLAAAAPAGPGPLGCPPIPPSVLITLIEEEPDTTTSTSQFIIGSSDNTFSTSGHYNRFKTAMRFDIAPGKTGCRLAVHPPALNPSNTYGQIDTKISMVEDVNSAMTWNNPPVVNAIQEPGLPAQFNWLGGPTNLFAHQGDCPESLSFLFEYNADWQTEGGWLNFQNQMSTDYSPDGFTIQYDC